MVEFDLFKLHNVTDIPNQSWICFKGPNLQKIIEKIRQELIIKHNLDSVKKLCKIIAQKLSCEVWTVEQVLYLHKEWIPIPILKILINMINNPKYKEIILEDVTYIKCNSAKSKPIKAVKNLNETLCKIAGAHAADGNINSSIGIEIKRNEKASIILKILKRYQRNAKVYKTCDRTRTAIKNISTERILEELIPFIKNRDITVWFRNGINLTEGSIEATFAFKRWLKDVFDIDVRLAEHGKKKAWRIDLDNKIIVRYLTKFLGFPLGQKTYTVKEPAVIKNSNIKFRKAFLLGLLTFEGYVPSSGDKIQISSRSRELIESVKEILDILNIPIRKTRQDSRNRWVCESKTLHNLELKKILDIFEKGTTKWQKINYGIEGFKYRCKDIEEAKELIQKTFTKHSTSKIDILELFEKIKVFKKTQFSVLKQIYNVNGSTLSRYLKILYRANIISIINSPINRMIIFNKNLNEWRLPKEIK